MLSGALPVMQTLGASIQEISSKYLPKASREQFLDELRRQVAQAIKELSEVTGEQVEFELETADVEPRDA